MSEIDESTVRLALGMQASIECLVLALEATGSLNREALAYVTERRLESFPEQSLEAVPLALLLRYLRPQDEPKPALRLIYGGKLP